MTTKDDRAENEKSPETNQTTKFNQLAECRSGLLLCNKNDRYVGAALLKYGEISGEETRLFQILVRPGMTVLEIGANIGVHTVALSRFVGAGTVHAYEPQRLVFQLLCANLALNNCANVFTYHAAVSDDPGYLSVPSLDPNAEANFGGVTLKGSGQSETVPALTVDGQSFDACHFIKVDVEGMEVCVLRGATQTIKRFRPLLYVENDRRNRSAELISLISSFDYRLYWHLPPLFEASNFRGDQENIFQGLVSINMICVPAELPQDLTTFREVSGPTDWWRGPA